MQNREQDKPQQNRSTYLNQGPQGNDKAPGEDSAIGNESPVSQAQKGQAKEDGDPGLPSDQAATPDKGKP